MRLSEWCLAAPAREAVSPKVLAAVESVLGALGSPRDPGCWITWGDEPATRWGLLAPTAAGLVTLAVRVAIPQEGPRVLGKLIRWSRVQVGDVTVEMHGGHRITSTSLEGVVLHGADDEADRIGAFLQTVLAALDGRPWPADDVATPLGGGADAG